MTASLHVCGSHPQHRREVSIQGRSRPVHADTVEPSMRQKNTKSREWLEDPCGAAVPDLDSLQADACGPTYTYDSNARLKLETKDHMRARGVNSPVERGAAALTSPEPVAPDAGFSRRLEYPASGAP